MPRIKGTRLGLHSIVADPGFPEWLPPARGARHPWCRAAGALLGLLLALSGFSAIPANAQSRLLRQDAQSDRAIDAATRRRVTERFASQVERSYIDGDLAASLAAGLRALARKDAWRGVTSSQAFAESLTSFAQAATRDLHLRVFFSSDTLPQGEGATLPSPEVVDEERRYTLSINHGIESVRRLPGNVGVLEVREFLLGADAKIGAALELLRDTDALIVDLREARGGRPEIARLLASELLPADSVLLDVTWQRENAESTKVWSLAQVPGQRYLGREVYVLTSRRTFSAAEMFAYSMQALRRVTVVGDTTGGGGHGMNFRTLDPHFAASIPFIRPVNPYTGLDWEGVGVRPDLPVPAERALERAHLEALRHLAAAASGPRRAALDAMIVDLGQGRVPREARPGGGVRIVRR